MFVNIVFMVVACLIKVAVSQDDSGEEVCPPLGSRSATVSCELSGNSASCSQAVVNTTARLMWRKKVIKNNKGVKEIRCSSPGIWTKSPVKVPGYDRVGELGLFKVSLAALPYDVADAVCQQDGARLMEIDTDAKVAFAKRILEQHPVFSGSEKSLDMWAGITNKKNLVDFETISGKPSTQILDFDKRAVLSNAPKKEMCATWYIKESRYYAVPCVWSVGFVCELPE